jgi:hypothetical protein
LYGISLFLVIENAFPAFHLPTKWQYAGIFMTLTTIVVNFCLCFILLQNCRLTIAHNFGILRWPAEIPLWFTLKSDYFIDLSLSGAFSEHKTKVLWRFHLIHHTDVLIDHNCQQASSWRKCYWFTYRDRSFTY